MIKSDCNESINNLLYWRFSFILFFFIHYKQMWHFWLNLNPKNEKEQIEL